MARASKAIDNPAVIRKAIETAEGAVAQEAPRTMRSEGAAETSLEPSRIIGADPSDRPVDNEKIAMEAFMHEMLRVRMPVSTDKNAEQIIEVNVNGNRHFLRRGEEENVPRYVVERMLRAKLTGYSQREVTNKAGVRDIVHDPMTAQRYDFTVLHDPHPRGEQWLRHLQMERG